MWLQILQNIWFSSFPGLSVHSSKSSNIALILKAKHQRMQADSKTTSHLISCSPADMFIWEQLIRELAPSPSGVQSSTKWEGAISASWKPFHFLQACWILTTYSLSNTKFSISQLKEGGKYQNRSILKCTVVLTKGKKKKISAERRMSSTEGGKGKCRKTHREERPQPWWVLEDK